MKEKIAILVDTASDIEIKEAEENGFFLCPLRVNFDDKSLKDRFDINSEELYKVMEKPNISTSTPLIGDAISVYEEIKAKNFTHVVVVALSSVISGTYNAFIKASEAIEGLTVEVIDSRGASASSRLLAYYAKDLLDSNTEFAEIVSRVKNKVPDTALYGAVTDLKYLVRGGRLNKASGLIGTILKVRPVLTLNDGTLILKEKVKGSTKYITRLKELALEFIGDSKKYDLAISYGNNIEDLEKTKAVFADLIDGANNYYEDTLSATLCVHSGPEVIIFGVIRLD